ncbi:hypothetical protein COS75_02705 [Candidatus Pacearchaeota archaeon CG06_land_8_20_14_3_00_35_12]|nr:MAG: hypothetical protein COS75_02705 [Candidatus Pacearchaeota archaeon CG06_land_8_20_14_3_00_35_12]
MNRKAISELVGYVLLIGMSMAMAGAVYAWLHFYVLNPLPSEKCPAEVSVIISEHTCGNGNLKLTVQNRGNFNISGYIVKINNVPIEHGEIVGKYPLCQTGYGSGESCNNIVVFQKPLAPGTSNLSSFIYTDYGEITAIEIEPFRCFKDGMPDCLCDKSILTQQMDCA